MNLAEKYRPRAWGEVVGQEKAISRIELLRKHGGFGAKVLWLSGASGTGKTTIGKLLAEEIASDITTLEIDAAELTPAMVKEIEKRTAGRALGGAGWCVLLNEAHGLRRDTVRQLLVTFERLAPCVTWILTSTAEGLETFEDQTDAAPLLSRCIHLALARRDLAKSFAERARTIAQAEGLDGKPIERYVRLIQETRNNLRAAINAIAAGAMLD